MMNNASVSALISAIIAVHFAVLGQPFDDFPSPFMTLAPQASGSQNQENEGMGGFYGAGGQLPAASSMDDSPFIFAGAGSGSGGIPRQASVLQNVGNIGPQNSVGPFAAAYNSLGLQGSMGLPRQASMIQQQQQSAIQPQPSIYGTGQTADIGGKQYQVLRKLPSGRDGKPYLAETLSGSQQVVLKQSKDPTGSQYNRERANLESAGRLLGSNSQTRTTVSPFFQGKSVYEVLTDERIPANLKQVVHQKYTTAIREFQRDHGMLHGDAHPHNAILTDIDYNNIVQELAQNRGKVVLIDLGRSRPINGNQLMQQSEISEAGSKASRLYRY